jgi:SAM-dependent methyltransferase
MIVANSRPSFSRWRWLSKQRTSLLRALENEILAGIHLRGMTLDVGGGINFGYYGLLKTEGVTHSVNITPAVMPTIIADLNMPLPLSSCSYDNVISFNTLEHLENDSLAFAEMIRVLKPGGAFHVTVPFLYRLHGRYGDFHRHSAEWWDVYIRSLGVPQERFRVIPLVWSPLSSALAQFPWFGGGRRGRLLRRVILLLPLVWPLSHRGNAKDATYHPFSLGYYISGTK